MAATSSTLCTESDYVDSVTTDSVYPRSVPFISPAPQIPPPDFGPTDTVRGWIVTGVITLIAGLLRFIRLTAPGTIDDGPTPIFDEKHYTPQAWAMLFNHGLEDNPGYGLVVHPPVGKWCIAVGEILFGYTPLGWRFCSAVLGTLTVMLVVRTMRRITRSTLTGAIAGLFLTFDTVHFIGSRTALLDVFITFFITAAFSMLMVDRDQVRERMYYATLAGRNLTTDEGPRLGVRWWRFSAGLLLGLAFGVKWSGLYYMGLFALMSFGFDISARRAYQVHRPWKGALVRDAGPTAYALLLVPFLVYMGSYSPWFASETGVYRHQEGLAIGEHWKYFPMPNALRSFWYYTHATLHFHAGLTNSAGMHHPWESKPFSWLLSLRPVLYAYKDHNIPGCGDKSCIREVLLVGAPALWWMSIPAMLFAVWRMYSRADWRYAAVMVAYCAGWAPWCLHLDRMMYFFYAIAMSPFLAMLIALICGDFLYHYPHARWASANSLPNQSTSTPVEAPLTAHETDQSGDSIPATEPSSTETSSTQPEHTGSSDTKSLSRFWKKTSSEVQKPKLNLSANQSRHFPSAQEITAGLIRVKDFLNRQLTNNMVRLILVSLYIGAVIANFMWLYPMVAGMPISQHTQHMELWLKSWH